MPTDRMPSLGISGQDARDGLPPGSSADCNLRDTPLLQVTDSRSDPTLRGDPPPPHRGQPCPQGRSSVLVQYSDQSVFCHADTLGHPSLLRHSVIQAAPDPTSKNEGGGSPHPVYVMTNKTARKQTSKHWGRKPAPTGQAAAASHPGLQPLCTDQGQRGYKTPVLSASPRPVIISGSSIQKQALREIG